MNQLFDALSAYFTAGTPEKRTKTLTALVDVYHQAEDAPEPEAISLPPADLDRLRSLAKQAGQESAEALLLTIIAAPPLMERIADFLTQPTVEAAAGLPQIIIRPENPVSRTIARIGIRADRVTVNFPEKRDDFRNLVKSLDYTWNGGKWGKIISGWNKASHAAAELGHRLLAVGFWIAPPTPEVRDMIVEESFEPEHRRKVMARSGGPYDGWFVLWWSRSEDCYDAAKRITASRYDKPVVVVPPEFYDEVEDFAALHDFYISPAAQQVIDRARAVLNAALLVQIEIDEPETEPATGNFPELAIPATIGIDDDLADDD